jgi:hypothetical protein
MKSSSFIIKEGINKGKSTQAEEMAMQRLNNQ